MSLKEDISIDKTDLQKRLIEIDKQIKNLSDEREAILLKLQNDFPNKKYFFVTNSNNNTNTQSSYSNHNYSKSQEKEVQTQIEEEMLNESQISANNLDSIQKEFQTFNDEILKNLDTLKLFFEKIWNIDYFDDESYYQGSQGTDREKMAYTKLAVFTLGNHIDDYDEKILQASLKEEYNQFSLDQFKEAIEKLFDALITRSKVLELYENCGKEAGQLYEHISSKGVSRLQLFNDNTYFLLKVIDSLLKNQSYFTWNYEKIKAIFYAWQAGIICRSTLDNTDEVEDYFDGLEKVLLNLLNAESPKLTEEQRAILSSILKAGKDNCNN